MNRLITSTAIPARELKIEALAGMSASFERLCLAAGLEALGEMMEADAQTARASGSCEVMMVEWRPPEGPTALAAHGSPWDAPVAVTRPCRHRCWSRPSGLNENRGRQRREDLRERQSPVATFEAAFGKNVGPRADTQGCRGIAPIGVGLPQAWVAGNQHSDPSVAGSPAKAERKIRLLPGNRQRLIAAPCKQGFLLLAQTKATPRNKRVMLRFWVSEARLCNSILDGMRRL